MSVVLCPVCDGRGFLRDVHGEAEDCEICLGEGSVDSIFVCPNPEAAWIADQQVKDAS